jgi:hydroxymethylpyrimidine/phosphomethylpyrimidine kinase
VYLKGGHLVDEGNVDMLFDGQSGKMLELTGEHLVTRNSHGTGCTLSSAIAAFLARGETLPQAAGMAKNYVSRALSRGADMVVGRGHGPLHHFHAWWTGF